ncbi:hypothetical protein HPP92_012218 [Vanilla planifolia]|uniref:NAD(P)-binding domain-containing protein n=1 Tax=Vanilla planifolia TaxID=51239 RepID=A0A835V1R7_VANPL|nr:hypothetical protein HPP92_012218 [Vanilla planifolia]
MDLAITSNSFRLASCPPSKFNSRSSRRLSAVSFAKQQGSPFSFGKRSRTAETENADASPTDKPNSFFFDLGKLSFPKSSLVPAVAPSSTSLFAVPRRKDPNTVFVAGATGQSGARIVLALLRMGFNVRAGVPDLTAAQELARLAAAYRAISPEESRRLNAVESTFADSQSIARAIGPAAKVVVTVGPGENGPTGEVSTEDALRVVQAAGLAAVGNVAVVYNLQSGGPFSGASTYNVLDGITSFFSNLFAQVAPPPTLAEVISRLVETDIAYTVVKAKLTDDYAPESSYSIVLESESNSGAASRLSNDSKVAKSQIAKLVADVFSNTAVAENKVVEVSTSVSASPKPLSELFSAIPEDGRRKAYAEALAKAKAEEEALALDKARVAVEDAKKLEEEAKLSKKEALVVNLAKQAQARAEATGSSLKDFLSIGKGFVGISPGRK